MIRKLLLAASILAATPTAFAQPTAIVGGRVVTNTSQGVIEAKNVVAATGPFQRPLIPTVVPAETGIMQIHSAQYRSPQQLPEGAADGQAQRVPDALKLYDAPELASQFTNEQGGAEALLSIEGIRCAACVWLIEKRLSQVPGLQSASLNVATEKLQVRWDAAQCKPSDILQAVREVGYVAYPYDPIQHGELLRKNARTLFKRLFVAGLSMMQVMMYAVPAYVAEAGAIEPDMESLMRWASLALTAPAVFYSALPFYQGAWSDLKARAPGMDVPVALGIIAAFVGSVWATVTGQGDVYFDSVTMFIFLLLGSRYLELVARRRAAGSLETMQHALPDAAWLVAGWPATRELQQVAAAQLRAGDVIPQVMAVVAERRPADAGEPFDLYARLGGKCPVCASPIVRISAMPFARLRWRRRCSSSRPFAA